MISKRTFVDTINTLKEKNQMECQIQDIITNHPNVCCDGLVPIDCTEQLIVNMINEWMSLPSNELVGTTLEWWMYEEQFGDDFNIGDIENITLPEDHKYRKPDLSDAEKLYDYLVWESSIADRISKVVSAED